jgi:hypothetical protein
VTALQRRAKLRRHVSFSGCFAEATCGLATDAPANARHSSPGLRRRASFYGCLEEARRGSASCPPLRRHASQSGYLDEATRGFAADFPADSMYGPPENIRTLAAPGSGKRKQRYPAKAEHEFAAPEVTAANSRTCTQASIREGKTALSAMAAAQGASADPSPRQPRNDAPGQACRLSESKRVRPTSGAAEAHVPLSPAAYGASRPAILVAGHSSEPRWPGSLEGRRVAAVTEDVAAARGVRPVPEEEVAWTIDSLQSPPTTKAEVGGCDRGFGGDN